VVFELDSSGRWTWNNKTTSAHYHFANSSLYIRTHIVHRVYFVSLRRALIPFFPVRDVISIFRTVTHTHTLPTTTFINLRRVRKYGLYYCFIFRSTGGRVRDETLPACHRLFFVFRNRYAVDGTRARRFCVFKFSAVHLRRGHGACKTRACFFFSLLLLSPTRICGVL